MPWRFSTRTKRYAEATGLALVRQDLERLESRLAEARQGGHACLLPLGWGVGLLATRGLAEDGRPGLPGDHRADRALLKGCTRVARFRRRGASCFSTTVPPLFRDGRCWRSWSNSRYGGLSLYVQGFLWFH